MQTVTADFIKGKKVLLRYDIDVPIDSGKVVDDFRLKAGLATLRLCLENATEVIILGHVGRPEGVDPKFSVEPVYDWFFANGFKKELDDKKLRLLENLRFESGEDKASLDYAKELAGFGEVFVNEAFAAFHPAASTTILPTLLPHAAGLNFTKEIEKLSEIRSHPKRPLVAIIGGAKVEDKLPVIASLSRIGDIVLVGGKLVTEIKPSMNLDHNVMIGSITEDGLDILPDSLDSWEKVIGGAKMVMWNGPVGKIEDEASAKGTKRLAQIILDSNVETVVGGGDTVGFLGKSGLLEQFQKHGFVSAGGGAMLELLTKRTLPTIEVLS